MNLALVNIATQSEIGDDLSVLRAQVELHLFYTVNRLPDLFLVILYSFHHYRRNP